jgi:hypothetical protein
VKTSFFAGRPRASYLKQWYRDMRAAIDDFELKILDLIARHESVPDAVLGMTPTEVVSYFEKARSELDAASSLMVLAEAEAVLRVDYLSRISSKGKDPVSRAFRELQKAKENQDKEGRVRLDQDLLETWVSKQEDCKAVVSEFRGALRLRHWLAHGRYWTPKLARPQYAARDVFEIADRLFAKLSDVTGWA